MNCQETKALLDGYVDGELDIVHSMDIAHHLQACPACADAYNNHQSLRSAIRGGELYWTPPADLHKRVQAAVRQAHRAETHPRPWTWRGLRVAVSLAVAAVLVLSLVPLLTGPAVNDRVTQDLIAGHVRSLMASHLTDIASSDQHTVKPWFEGKLDFSPPVTDLADQGFPLVGGRLEYLDNRPVAVLVYRHQQHVINLFVWPATPGTSAGVQTTVRQGYQLLHWTQGGLQYWAVSNLNLGELQTFIQAVQQATQPPPGTSTSRG
jgi:anti-sigma factor RsiW